VKIKGCVAAVVEVVRFCTARIATLEEAIEVGELAEMLKTSAKEI